MRGDFADKRVVTQVDEWMAIIRELSQERLSSDLSTSAEIDVRTRVVLALTDQIIQANRAGREVNVKAKETASRIARRGRASLPVPVIERLLVGDAGGARGDPQARRRDGRSATLGARRQVGGRLTRDKALCLWQRSEHADTEHSTAL